MDVARGVIDANRSELFARSEVRETSPYLHVPIAALLLVTFALWNGSPLLYEDTHAYIGRIARAIGVGPDWLTQGWTPDIKGGTPGGPPVRAGEEWLAGRSVYWGVAAYLAALIGGLWGIVALNAVGVATVLSILWFRGLRQSAALPFYLIVAAVAVTTALGPYVALLTPDSLAGVLVLSLGLLASCWTRLARLDRAVLIALAAFAVVSHDSLLPLTLGLCAIGFLVGWQVIAPGSRKFLGLALAAPLLAGVAGHLLFSAAAVATTGREPLRMPFLTARLASTPVGLDYLARACPDAGFTVCAYRDRLPVSWTDFLFHPDIGVFESASLQVRRALGAEQVRFAVAIFADSPGRTMVMLGKDMAEQLVTSDLDDLEQRDKADFFARFFPDHAVENARGSRVWNDSTILDRVHLLDSVAAWFGAGVLLLALLFRRRLGVPAPVIGLIALTLLGIVMNAVVCGMLASPWGRFQARLLWILPFLAFALLGARLFVDRSVKGVSTWLK